MAILKYDGTTVTAPSEDGILTNMIDGLKAPMLAEDEYLDSSSSFWAAAIYGFGGSLIGGYFGRKRADDGKAPIAGFMY